MTPSSADANPAIVPASTASTRMITVAEWLKRLRAAEVPAAPVNNLDGAFAEPPVAEREMIVEYDHPDVGKVRMPGNPIKISGISKTISRPAPRLGEHTDAVLSEVLGLPDAEIAGLHDRKIIAGPDGR